VKKAKMKAKSVILCPSLVLSEWYGTVVFFPKLLKIERRSHRILHRTVMAATEVIVGSQAQISNFRVAVSHGSTVPIIMTGTRSSLVSHAVEF
jgi:hypothetical protein